MTTLAVHRKQFIAIAAILTGMGFVLVYRGIGWHFVRGYIGDWLIVQLMYVIARFWVPYRWRYPLALAVLLFAFGVEFYQLLAAGTIPDTLLTELTIGSKFDRGDLLAYTLGVAAVLWTERFWKS